MIYGNTRYPQRPSVTGAFRGARRKMCNKLRRETKLLPYYAAVFRFNDCVSLETIRNSENSQRCPKSVTLCSFAIESLNVQNDIYRGSRSWFDDNIGPANILPISGSIVISYTLSFDNLFYFFLFQVVIFYFSYKRNLRSLHCVTFETIWKQSGYKTNLVDQLVRDEARSEAMVTHPVISTRRALNTIFSAGFDRTWRASVPQSRTGAARPIW